MKVRQPILEKHPEYNRFEITRRIELQCSAIGPMDAEYVEVEVLEPRDGYSLGQRLVVRISEVVPD